MAALLGGALVTGIAHAATDLSALLAPPPSSDWLELTPTTTSVIGAFDAHRYGVWVDDKGNSEQALKADGFVSGYDRMWEQQVTQDDLEERIFEFRDAGGAGDWYQGLKLYNESAKEHKRDIPSLGGSSSFGAEMVSGDGNHAFRVYFTKGNLMLEVQMYSDTNDLAVATLAQAQVQYAFAPASVALTEEQTQNGTAAGNAAAIAFLGVIAVGTIAFFLLGRRRRSIRFAGSLAGLHMSADGNYWWDGQEWRSVATDPPPILPT